ncbi:MAG: type IV pilus secretin PilQ [Nitrospirae bacterium]|nr:type IV pilus secretin PilQ [Nitrospirota bacterium]
MLCNFKKTRLLYFLFLIFHFSFFILSSGSSVNAEEQPKKQEITAVDVKEAGDSTEIHIDGSAHFTYKVYKSSDPYILIVELQGLGAGKFKDKITFDKAGVLDIIPSEAAGAAKAAKLEISLTVPTEVKPIQKGNLLVLTFPNPDIATADVQQPVKRLAGKKAAAKEETKENSQISQGKYTGEKISLDFQDADLLHIFRLLSDVSGYNIVVSPEVKGKFSMRLMNVPWDQALDVILRNYGLSKTTEGNIIRVAPTAVLSKESEEIAKAKEAEIKAGDIETRIYPINYADVDKVKGTIETAKVLTAMGNISTDKRTSSVIIKDVKDKHIEYERLIRSLDQQTPQVSIEARIVEVERKFTKELGIQWGMLWKPADSRTTIGGISGLPGGTGFNSANPLLVNLPAAVGSGSGGAIGLGYINAANTFTLDLQLSAMESSGKGKIISNPRITTMDNEKATIKQGNEIPYFTSTSDKIEVNFKEAVLELSVTPHITPDGTIVMEILAKNDEVDASKPNPPISKKEAQTKVLVKDGDTLVIGGILKTTKRDNLDGVPGISKVPVLGWLFKKEKEIDDTNELLIFITPKIVKHMQ